MDVIVGFGKLNFNLFVSEYWGEQYCLLNDHNPVKQAFNQWITICSFGAVVSSAFQFFKICVISSFDALNADNSVDVYYPELVISIK